MRHFITPRQVRPIVLAASQLTASTVLTAALLPVFGRHAIHLRWDAALAAVVLGAVGTGVAYVVNYRLIAESGASATSSVTYLMPIVAIAAGSVVLGESPAGHVLVGVVVVLLGVMLTRQGRRAARPKAQASRSP